MSVSSFYPLLLKSWGGTLCLCELMIFYCFPTQVADLHRQPMTRNCPTELVQLVSQKENASGPRTLAMTCLTPLHILR